MSAMEFYLAILFENFESHFYFIVKHMWVYSSCVLRIYLSDKALFVKSRWYRTPPLQIVLPSKTKAKKKNVKKQIKKKHEENFRIYIFYTLYIFIMISYIFIIDEWIGINTVFFHIQNNIFKLLHAGVFFGQIYEISTKCQRCKYFAS